MKRSDRVGNRIDLAHLCNEMGLIRNAVEVGTDCGIFAEEFLQRWCGERLWCVDNWRPYPGMPYDRSGDMAVAVQRLSHFGRRVKLYRADSREAAKSCCPQSPMQFIYIDGAHDYDSVIADLRAWWPRLARPGVLAGHDIDLPDVRRAVKEFAEAQRLAVWETSDFYSPSWYAIV